MSSLAEAAAERRAVEAALAEVREALAHQEADTVAARSEARVLARQLEVRLMSSCSLISVWSDGVYGDNLTRNSNQWLAKSN